MWAGIFVATFVTLLDATPWGVEDNLVVPLATAGALRVVPGIGLRHLPDRGQFPAPEIYRGAPAAEAEPGIPR